MKKGSKTLTYEQAMELKFFCRSVVGTRQEFYALYDQMEKFKSKLDRMDKTCKLIGEYFGEEIKAFENVWKDMKEESK